MDDELAKIIDEVQISKTGSYTCIHVDR